MMFAADLSAQASALINRCRAKDLRIATAESCTGGMVAALVTSIAGSSDVFEAGFVTYSNSAKTAMIGVPADMIVQVGAVSAEVARAMASGALAHSQAELSVAITGVAGPGGGSVAKPIGLVYLAAASKGGAILERELRLGGIGRDAVRLASTEVAIAMLYELAGRAP